MGMENSFTNSIDLLSRALDVQTLRYQVTSNNIANSETPGFKKQYVNFESELKRAYESQAAEHESFRMITSDPKHLESQVPKDWRSVEPRRVTDYVTSSKANGNNVDAEEEAMNLVQIQLEYQLLTQLTNFEFKQISTAIQTGR